MPINLSDLHSLFAQCAKHYVIHRCSGDEVIGCIIHETTWVFTYFLLPYRLASLRISMSSIIVWVQVMLSLHRIVIWCNVSYQFKHASMSNNPTQRLQNKCAYNVSSGGCACNDLTCNFIIAPASFSPRTTAARLEVNELNACKKEVHSSARSAHVDTSVFGCDVHEEWWIEDHGRKQKISLSWYRTFFSRIQGEFAWYVGMHGPRTETVLPPPVKRGDKVSIIAPSGPVDEKLLDAGGAILRLW